jgi:uncharacterized protein
MNNIYQQEEGTYAKGATREFFRDVYTYMFVALGLSGAIAYYIGSSDLVIIGNGRAFPELYVKYFLSSTGGNSPLFYVVFFAMFGLSWFIQSAFQRLSMSLLMILFVVFSVLMGLFLSNVFTQYTATSIYSTFFVSAGAFAVMAVLGYTTKTDLTKMGSLLYMAFIGVFIAGIVNVFMGSDMLGFIIACIGVFVFTGLTAYYMQNLKKISQDSGMDSMERSKLAIVGGLTLYMLFINLFLSLLRVLGGRD